MAPMRAHAALVALLALGCEGDPTKDQTSKTGSRLQVLSYEMADGSRLVRGFWDSETQEDCDVRAYADGTLRCVPSLAYKLGPYFRTSSCFGEQLAVVGKEFAPRTRFLELTDGVRVRVFRVGGTTNVAYQGTPENCVELAVDDKQTAYYPGDELPSSQFVEAFEQRNP